MNKNMDEEEKRLIRKLFCRPDGVKELMRLTGRSYGSIVAAANRLGLYRTQQMDIDPEVWITDFKPDPHRSDRTIQALKTMICPGNGNGFCGSPLAYEPMFPGEWGQKTRPIGFDLICWNRTHRHVITEEHLFKVGMLKRKPSEETCLAEAPHNLRAGSDDLGDEGGALRDHPTPEIRESEPRGKEGDPIPAQNQADPSERTIELMIERMING